MLLYGIMALLNILKMKSNQMFLDSGVYRRGQEGPAVTASMDLEVSDKLFAYSSRE